MTTALMPTAARPAQSLSEFFDGVFGPTYSVFNDFGAQTYQGLPTNVYEVGDTYQIAMLIPGIDPESIQVTALGNTITVAGASSHLKVSDGSDNTLYLSNGSTLSVTNASCEASSS